MDIENIDLRDSQTKKEQKKIINKYNYKRLKEDKNTPFVHLHLHTFHSILDGCGSIDDYIKLAKKYNHPAMAITDHGTLSGLFEFYTKCKKAGIKPILGFEAYINDRMGEFEEKKYEGGNAHQIILIKSNKGYVNANKLAYLSFTKGFYRRGRIKTDWLIEHKEGLIISTACVASQIAKFLEKKEYQKAEEYFVKLKNEFKEDFYAEIQLNEYGFQKTYNSFLIELASKYNVKIIITSDVHYAYPEDAELQDTLIAINQHKSLENSFKLDTRSLYYASSQDILNFNYKFGYNYPVEFLEMCMRNTLEVADKCNFDFELGEEKYPRYEPTEDVVKYFGTNNVKEIITKLAFAKLKQKINEYKKNNIVHINQDKIKKYVDRLNYELKVIDDKKMLDYFLVNWEIIRDYRSKGFEVGTARGSAAGSLLSWCLDITKIDPLRFGLYFERFLNPTRKSPPDIDIDYMSDTDNVTNNFLIQKYGKERVLSVSTFSTFNEKGTLKDVVRAHRGNEATGLDSIVARVTKEMPNWKKVDYGLKEWFEEWPKNPECSPDVKEWLTNPNNKKILYQTLRLQGQIRGIGQHAAGVVITPSESWNYIPTNIIPKQKSVVTAFQESDGGGKDLSALGILKLDRLKLDTINVIQDAIKLIKEHKNKDITQEIAYIDLNDSNLYYELNLGLNTGIFQFESHGMNALIKGIKVDKFEEMVAANALYRPGPMGIGAHEEYVRNKFKPQEIKYIHPIFENILGESNGVLVFQEQVMFIAHEIGDMDLGEGDMLRRYMDKAGKMIAKENNGELSDEERNSDKYQNFLKYWNKFLQGAKQRGYSDEVVTKIKDWLIQYLGYSFNKSHCVSYSYIAAQTLFLKHYYPTEFYTALLNHPKTSGGKEKEQRWLSNAIASAISKGITIKPPSRKSGWNWTMTGDKEISMGFSGINGMGSKAWEELERLLNIENTTLDKISISKFFHLPFSAFNKSAFNACVKAGVFDDWSDSREHLISLKQKKIKKRDPLQGALFDLDTEDFSSSLKNHNFEPTSDFVKKTEFIEVCNFDLDKIRDVVKIKEQLKIKANRIIENILNFTEDDYYFFFIDDIHTTITNKGTEYLTIKVGDGISHTTLRAFPSRNNNSNDLYNKIKEEGKINGVYIAQFVKNKKGFINFKNNAKFKRIK